jgi:SAM-dependent methyltransferase
MASIQVKPTNPSPAARGPDRPTARIELVIALERLAGRLHRWGRIKPAAAPVKVNLGSGLFVARGWINIDGSLKALLARSPAFVLHAIHPWFANSGATREQFITLLRGNRFVHHDLKYGIPLPDSSADFVFSSHMLHHLYRDQAARMLAETMRVLKPGGIMRLVVPDLEYIMALYQRGNREQALSYFFYPSLRSDLFTRRYRTTLPCSRPCSPRPDSAKSTAAPIAREQPRTWTYWIACLKNRFTSKRNDLFLDAVSERGLLASENPELPGHVDSPRSLRACEVALDFSEWYRPSGQCTFLRAYDLIVTLGMPCHPSMRRNTI